ncbi:MAG TPA: fructosamine kinase family protein [Thiobacillaceae bacterium]|nr:fructosamine kinase family protein [Thiobacillaceae bacterium]
MINDIAAAIARATGTAFVPRRQASLGGGCINQALRLSDGKRSFFVKINGATCLPMFEAEAAGLEEILATHSLRAPRPVCYGASDGAAWLVLEYLELGGRGRGAEMGRQLAQMHHTTATQFGWTRDNTIGSTPQPNAWAGSWIDFFRDRRLGYQLELAAQKGFGAALQRKGERLRGDLDAFFSAYQPVSSLLHGDLWGGNAGYMRSGEAVVFDPAVYYGDREADLAMTELFGGFGADFYAAYREAWPVDAGYAVRKMLYNLYHILNHAYLFGGGYAMQAQAMMDRLLADLG